MPFLASAALALALQEPQNELNTASLIAKESGASTPKQQQQAQDAPAPADEGLASLDALDDAIEDFGREFEAGWNVDVSGYLKFGVVGSDANRLITNSDDLLAWSLTAARLWVDAEIEGWHLRMGLRGEQHTGLGFFGVTGDVGNLRMFELVATRELGENVRVQMGRVRAPFVQSALYDDNQLLFFERSFIGEDWDAFTNGGTLNVRLGDLEGWIGVQNGFDNFGHNVALTGRGMWHITGGGAIHVNEGPFDAPEELAISVGGAVYYDTDTDDVSSQALEAFVSARPIYLAAEVVDKGEGIGDLYSWVVTGSVLLGDTWSVQARLENFDRDDGTDLYRVGVNKYLEGHDVKLHLEYSAAESNAPLVDLSAITFGAQVSF